MYLEELLKNPNTAEIPLWLNIIPSLYFRRDTFGVKQQQGQVRFAFRNQRFDPVNRPCDVVTTVNREEGTEATLCLWEPSLPGKDSSVRELYVGAIPAENLSAKEVTSRYNTISRTWRNGLLSSPSLTSFTVRIARWRPLDESSAEIEVVINDRKILAYVAVPAQESEAPQQILCHFPLLGTWVEYQRHTLLSYHNGLRQTIVSGSSAGQDKAVKAPMPCKILSLLKTSGETVKEGENVLVIESMKMEVSIAVALSGVLQTRWKVGDAVDEGDILCWVE
jgi:biotin carboxyl carrier protein